MSLSCSYLFHSARKLTVFTDDQIKPRKKGDKIEIRMY